MDIDYRIKNDTTGRTSTLFSALSSSGAVPIPGYRAAVTGSLTGTTLINVLIEGATTGYKINDLDLGNVYCPRYATFTVSGQEQVRQYSSCTILMIGGGGGGGGSQIQPTLTGGAGGDGGISIFERVPLSGVTAVTVVVGTAGGSGLGFQTTPPRIATAGNTGNSTSVTFTSGAVYTANGGSGGPLSNPDAPSGDVTPTGGITFQGSLNGFFTYQYTPDRVITVGVTNYGQGGAGGNIQTPTQGSSGVVGRPGYVRIYLYP